MDALQPTNEVRPQSSDDERRLRDVGLRWACKGTHTRKTMMLHELGLLLGGCSPDASRGEYLSAILEDHCLAKQAARAARKGKP